MNIEMILFQLNNSGIRFGLFVEEKGFDKYWNYTQGTRHCIDISFNNLLFYANVHTAR